jgi:hypothetical protein
MSSFPLQAILFWIAVTLAPPDTSQILVKGPDATWAWTKQTSGWSFSADRSVWSAEENAVTTSIKGKERKRDENVAPYVKGVKDHDWKESATLELPSSASLAKRGETYLYTFDEGSDTAKPYVIRFRRTPAAAKALAAKAGKSAGSATSAAADDAAKAENILSNPGAEKGDEDPDDWAQGAQVEGVKYVWDKKVAFEGKASLCIVKTVNRYFPIAQWSQTVDRKGDLPCLEVSAQVKAAKMSKAVLDVVFLDRDGQWISHHWAAYIGSKEQGDPPADHDWKKYSGTIEIPSGTTKICVALQDYGSGKVWFDDIRAKYVASSGAEK